jgi:hypothetical protein
MMLIEKQQRKLMKLKIKEKIILDLKHQNIIAALNQKIEKLEIDNKEMANIEKQHKYMNGELHKEVAKLTKENEYLKKENVIIREGNEHLKIYRDKLVDVLEIALTHEPKRDGYKIELNELTDKGPKSLYKISCNGVPTYRNIINFKK